jgi:hypothetical protein
MRLVNQRRRWALVLLGCLWAWLLPWTPAWAQGPGGSGAILEKPAAPEEKKAEAPTTCGPLISDTCIPIEEHHASLQFLASYFCFAGNFTPNWRKVSAGGNFHTLFMPVKFTYGPVKNLETYVIVPYVHNFANSVNVPGPNGETSANYGGIGDISWFGKYLLLEEGDIRPAVTGVLGAGFPTGHAHNLNPGRLGQDAIGSGAFTFTTGVNLYKWVKPFLVYSNIWLNSPVNLFHASDENVRSREFVTFNLAVEYPFNPKWIALVEMYSSWTWNNIYTPLGFQTPTTLLGVLTGLEYFMTEKWAFSAGASIDLVGKFGGCKYTPIATVYYNF